MKITYNAHFKQTIEWKNIINYEFVDFYACEWKNGNTKFLKL
jgi:hypothetical protein